MQPGSPMARAMVARMSPVEQYELCLLAAQYVTARTFGGNHEVYDKLARHVLVHRQQAARELRAAE